MTSSTDTILFYGNKNPPAPPPHEDNSCESSNPDIVKTRSNNFAIFIFTRASEVLSLPETP